MTIRLLSVLTSFTLQAGCVDRAMGDDALAPYDPSADDRTNAEILRDACEIWIACKIDGPDLVDEPTCWWYFDYIHTGFEMSPEKAPECAVALWDHLECASQADSCEDFRASFFYYSQDSNHRCDEPRERFDAFYCGA